MSANTTSPTLPPGPLDEHQAKQLLRRFDIPVVEERVVHDEDQAVAAAERLGYPVVLKGLGRTLQHKTEMGLVHLHLQDADGVRAAAGRIAAAAGTALEGLLVQSHIGGQRELMTGLFRDPQFGPVVLFGLGGTLTEAVGDVTLRLAPLDEKEAERMVAEIRSQKLLGPFRGEQAVDREVLERVLRGISRLALAHPEIAEIDVNPLRVMPDGRIVAVDALVVVRDAAPRQAETPPVSAREIGALFHPRSIAFIGASSQLGKWGNMLMSNTIAGGYQGKIFLVNPKGGVIAGRPVYTRVGDIPDAVDLAVVTVPAERVIDLMPQCQSKKIRYMVLISSGFAETGAEGKALESRLIDAAQAAGILVLGPNTMGITNPHIRLFATGATVTPIPGHSAIVAQSGNMGSQLLGFAEQQGIGIRGFSGSGNEAMITMADYLEGFESDEMTRTVLMYAEGFKNGRRFFESARRISRRKPIVLLKGGQSQAGQKAAASHSGAMTTDSRVFDALCRQAGIIRVHRPMDLLDVAAAFDSVPLPRGPRVAIMTFGGGWGVVTTDLCQYQGLAIPELDPHIVREIDTLLPPFWSRANPVDLVGDFNPAMTLKVLEMLMRWDGCDAVLNLGIMGRRVLIERLIRSITTADPDYPKDFIEPVGEFLMQFEKDFLARSIELMTELEKPVLGVSLRADSDYQTVMGLPGARYKGVYYQTPERAVLALAKMVAYHRYLVG